VRAAKKFLWIALVVCCLSAGVSLYLIFHHYTLLNGEGSFHSVCAINATLDCDVVNASRYSEVFGMPIATLQWAFSVFSILLILMGLLNVYFIRTSTILLFFFSFLGALASLGALFVSGFVLQKICIFCSLLQLLNFISYFLAYKLWKSLDIKNSYFSEFKNIKRSSAIGYLIAGCILLGFSHLFASQLAKPLPLDEETFVSEFRSQPIISFELGSSPRMGFVGYNPLVQVLEFADFQCPACGLAAKHMHRLTKLYQDKIQVVFKNYPLDSDCNPNMPYRMHPHACFAAKAGLCANKQGKFMELYEKLFENQKILSLESVKIWAKDSGIDLEKWELCLKSPQIEQELQNDILQGQKANLRSTPTFFFNGKKVEGAIDEKRLRLILKELGKL